MRNSTYPKSKLPVNSNNHDKLFNQNLAEDIDEFATETLHHPLPRKRSISCASSAPSIYPTSIASSLDANTSHISSNTTIPIIRNEVNTSPTTVSLRPCPSRGFSPAVLDEDADNVYFPQVYLNANLPSSSSNSDAPDEQCLHLNQTPTSEDWISGSAFTETPIYRSCHPSQVFQQKTPFSLIRQPQQQGCGWPFAKARSKFTETSRASQQITQQPLLPHILNELAELTQLNRESQPIESGAAGDKDSDNRRNFSKGSHLIPIRSSFEIPYSASKPSKIDVHCSFENDKVLQDSTDSLCLPSKNMNLRSAIKRRPWHKRNLRANYLYQHLQNLEDKGMLTEQQSAFLPPGHQQLLERIRQRSYKLTNHKTGCACAMNQRCYGKPKWNPDPRPLPKETVESLASAEAKLRALDNGYYFPYFEREPSLYTLVRAMWNEKG